MPCWTDSAGKAQVLAQLLIIDDDHATLDSVQHILIAAGWSARATSDPHMAPEIFKADREVAVAITGVHMSAMDGFALIRRLRQTAPSYRTFKPLIMTHSVDLNVATNAIEHQVSGIVAKPVSPSSLKQKVSEAWSSMDAAAPHPNTRPSQGMKPSVYGRESDEDNDEALEQPWSGIASAIARKACNLLLDRVGNVLSEAAVDGNEPTLASQQQSAAAKTAPSVDLLLSIMKLKRSHFPEPLFSDPCWDMLLDLGMSHIEQRSISVSSLCIAAGIPQTTALRRITDLENIGLVTRAKDPNDGRRIYIALTDLGLERLYGFIEKLPDEMHQRWRSPAIWSLLQRRQQAPDYSEASH